MEIKRLCLANGDEYEEVVTSLSLAELKIAMTNGEAITVVTSGKDVVLNSEFIVSFEVAELKGLVSAQPSNKKLQDFISFHSGLDKK